MHSGSCMPRTDRRLISRVPGALFTGLVGHERRRYTDHVAVSKTLTAPASATDVTGHSKWPTHGERHSLMRARTLYKLLVPDAYLSVVKRYAYSRGKGRYTLPVNTARVLVGWSLTSLFSTIRLCQRRTARVCGCRKVHPVYTGRKLGPYLRAVFTVSA